MKNNALKRSRKSNGRRNARALQRQGRVPDREGGGPNVASQRNGGVGATVQQVMRHSLNIPLPDSMITRFVCEGDYKIPIAAASITGGAVKLNSPWLPFRPGGATAFPSYNFLGPATEATLLPTGWSQLATTNLYREYKVIRSTIQIRWNGSNSGNNVMLVVTPAVNTASFTSVYTLRTSRLARQATFSVSKPNGGCDKEGWFSYSINPYEVFGANRAESKGDLLLSTLFNTDPVVTQWWFIDLQSNDQDVSATTASTLQVRVIYDVELMGMTQMSQT